MKKYIYMIKRINEATERQINRELKMHDITYSQIRVIFVLGRCGTENCSLKELERIFGTSQQTICGLIQRLELKGLVESFTVPEEKRAKRVRLTAAGREMDKVLQSKMEELESQIMEGISGEECAMIGSVLQRIENNLAGMGALSECMPEDVTDMTP